MEHIMVGKSVMKNTETDETISVSSVSVFHVLHEQRYSFTVYVWYSYADWNVS